MEVQSATQVVDYDSLEAQAAQSLILSQQSMIQSNGSPQPSHIRKQVTMTQEQLEEQKMNEKQGLPSNLDEAARVKQLESQMGRIELLLSQLVDLPHQPSIPDLRHIPSPQHQLFPAVAQSPSNDLGRLTSSSGSSPSPMRQVRLSNGTVVNAPSPPSPPTSRTIPPMSLGESGGLVEQPESDLFEVVEEVAPVMDPVRDQRAEKIADLVTMVQQCLLAKDPHKRFRQVLPNLIGRHAGYSGWGKATKVQFDERFAQTLNDPVFLKNIVEKVLDMEMGYGMSPQKVADLATLCAGFVSFALAGV